MKFINSFFELGEGFFTAGNIDVPDGAFLLNYNNKLGKEIGLDINESEVLGYFSGKRKFRGSKIYSTVYSGHQFGSYVNRLGDGRVHFIGEVLNQKGNSYEIQLKGSGKTEYSRFGDGKAVLRSSIREYLASEALFHLGIPTTRALCIIGSDENVEREIVEKASIVTRVAPSFIRFGHFEYFTYSGQKENTKKLADYVIDRFYTDIKNDRKKYNKFFYQIVLRTAKLLAKWQSFGFVHGVMNTDNMSILGLTLDYGPFGFMDGFDSSYISNGSDHTGRYSYNNQPFIAMWNLQALAYALEPVLKLDESMEILSLFRDLFEEEYFALMRGKLGLNKKYGEDVKLVSSILTIMEEQDVDYTIFFRQLSEHRIDTEKSLIDGLFSRSDSLKEWKIKYNKRLLREGWNKLSANSDKYYTERRSSMNKVNPKYILRNYIAENAITCAKNGDFCEFKKILKILEKPYDEQEKFENYSSLPPEWSKEVIITCSS